MNENNMTDISNMTTTTDPELDYRLDCLFRDVANVVKNAPYFANEKLQAAKERLQMLQDKACSTCARVHGGPCHGSPCYGGICHYMGDQAYDILEAKGAVRAAETEYDESVWLLELVCRVAWFDDFQTSVWVQHYGNLQSVEAIAEHLNTTESRVLCVLNDVSPGWNFSIGVDRLQKAQKTLAAECERLQHPDTEVN